MLRLQRMEEQREAQRAKELMLLQQKLAKIESKPSIVVPPPVTAGVAKPAPKPLITRVPNSPLSIGVRNSDALADHRAELSQLISDTDLIGELLQRTEKLKRKGVILSSQQAQFIADIEKEPRWQQRKAELKLWHHRAEKAFQAAFLNKPDDLKNKLSLQFDPNTPMNLRNLIGQLYQKMPGDMPTENYQILAEVLGDTGAEAIANILKHYSQWLTVIKK